MSTGSGVGIKNDCGVGIKSMSVKNLLKRIPTEDERSHRNIARMQRSQTPDFWTESRTQILMVD